MELESPSRGRDRKHFLEQWPNFSKFDKNFKPTDLTIPTNPKHKKNCEATVKYVKIYLFKNNEEKKFKVNQR